MIGAIYSLLNKIWRLLSSFSRVRNAIYWGTGEGGNVYIGPLADAPAGYTVIDTTDYTFPEATLFRYKNLIINCPCTFKMSPIVIQATDSITVTEHGWLNVDNLGSNARDAHFLYTNIGSTPTLTLSDDKGASTSPNGTLLIRTYFANNLPLDYRVHLTGASANNKGISNGGTSGASGGLVIIYTAIGGLVTSTGTPITYDSMAAGKITANGVQSGGNGGGMLSILTPKLCVDGKISSNGSHTGNVGTLSTLNKVPYANTNTNYGGGGLAMAFELPIKDI